MNYPPVIFAVNDSIKYVRCQYIKRFRIGDTTFVYEYAYETTTLGVIG